MGGGIVQWVGVGRGGWMRAVRHRHRDLGLDSLSLVVQRPDGSASDVRNGQSIRRHGAFLDDGQDRADVPHGGRLRAGAERDCRTGRMDRNGTGAPTLQIGGAGGIGGRGAARGGHQFRRCARCALRFRSAGRGFAAGRYPLGCGCECDRDGGSGVGIRGVHRLRRESGAVRAGGPRRFASRIGVAGNGLSAGATHSSEGDALAGRAPLRL